MLKFESFEDKVLLAKLLTKGNIEQFEANYKYNFDFRPVNVKRKEFNGKRYLLYRKLAIKHGERCKYNLNKNCLKNRNLQIDHVIPLSSNILNKLKGKKAEKGKKVPTQILGSNHIDNLVLACKKCNGFKKHRIIPTKI